MTCRNRTAREVRVTSWADVAPALAEPSKSKPARKRAAKKAKRR